MRVLPHPCRPSGIVRIAADKTLLQSFEESCLLAKISPATLEASITHSRSKSISDGVSIRGAGEVPSLRLSKSIEGVAEMLPPLLLEVRSVYPSEFMELLS